MKTLCRLLGIFAFGLITIYSMPVDAAPTVTRVEPTSGPIGGTTRVSVVGTNFVNGATVSFGGSAGTDVTTAGTSTSLFVTAPAHAAGIVDITVTNPDTQSGTLVNAYTYVDAAPTVTRVEPTSGPIGGTTRVSVVGTNFVNGATVSFGGSAGTDVTTAGTSTSLFVTAPAHAAGIVDITVTNPDTQSGTLVNAYTYVDAAPTVTRVEPTSGPIGGTTRVSVVGTNFVNGATVSFGGSAGTDVTTAGTSTSLFVTAPAHAAGIVDITVTNPDTQSGTLVNAYTYVDAAPTVTRVEPTSGPIGGTTRVSVVGTNFVNGATVSFGGSAGTDVTTAGTSTSLFVTAPAHAAGIVDITVTNPDTQSGTLVNAYTYVDAAPTVTRVEPTSGPIGGTTRVSVVGTNFVNGATVSFGGSAGTDVTTAGTSTSLFVTAPAHAAGIVDITVTNPDTQSGTLVNAYTYVDAAPTVTRVEPTSGPIGGTTRVSVVGTNFVNGATVSFGGSAGTDVTTAGTSTSLFVTAPAHAAGIVDITVTNPDTQSGTLVNAYTYVDADSAVYVNKNDGTCGGKSPCYTSIQTGINAAGTVSAIRIVKGTYAESITLNSSKSLTLQGGWNSSYTTQTSNTTFIKAPKAPQGSLTLQMVTIKP